MEWAKHTGTGRTHQDHAHAIDGLGLARSTFLELLDTFLERGDDIVQPLHLIVYDTHLWQSEVKEEPDQGR